MKKAEGGRSQGYTILETMIFLAVSAAMFISAMAFIGGRQARTQFSTSVRNFEARMSDISSDVSTGYYASGDADNSKIRCTATNAGPVPKNNGAGVQRGAGKGCLFIGQAVQFGADSDKEKYATFGLIGLQYIGANVTNGDVIDLNEARSRPLTKYGLSTDIPETKQVSSLEGGASIECVLRGSNASPALAANEPCKPSNIPSGLQETDAVLFISKFSEQNYQDETVGANKVDIVTLNEPAISPASRSTGQLASELVDLTITGVGPKASIPKSGVLVCMQATGTRQFAIVRLGGQTSQTSTSSQIFDGVCK